jgi:hypothetical protein
MARPTLFTISKKWRRKLKEAKHSRLASAVNYNSLKRSSSLKTAAKTDT